MKEHLLHFIWQNRLFNTRHLKTTEGQEIQILSNGKHNKDGGPDFLQAKVRIDDITLVGNIELHIQASDWKLHRHHQDRKYDNVILHVVYNNDEPLDTHLPTLELNGRISAILLDKYEAMMHSKDELICRPHLSVIDTFTLENWKERMVIERLERKSQDILMHLKANDNDWEMTCYQLLGKYFGSHINKEPFEMLTRLLEYKVILKYTENVFQLEALLFGVAGLLNKDFVEVYPRELKQEYLFLKHKHDLKQLQEHQWQFLRIRPVSFPTIRIAWFARLMQHLPLMQHILDAEAPQEILNDLSVSWYWNHHYVLDKLSKTGPKMMGGEFKNTLQINVFAPLLYAYGKFTGADKYIQKAMDMLQALPPEQNSKIRIVEGTSLEPATAFQTQAVLELYDGYCSRKRCLECAIGHKILRTDKQGILAEPYYL